MDIVKKYRWFIVIATLVAVGASIVFSYIKPVYYDTSISFAINRVNKQETQDYQFDGYYAIQASDLFSQTVMSWFMTPSVLLEMYELAGIDPQISTIEELTSRFKAKKFSPQNIVIRYKERDQKTAENIAQAIITTVEEMAAESNQTSDHKSLFMVVGSKPVVVEKKPVIWLNGVIGLASGLVISLVISYFIAYWQINSRREDT
ncbi:hypothetical protein KKF61_04485 [Patescibacteria group bacterium]|nr:hypothetical protein [Patescibacteria group bacterium]MBU0964332.1 hypothetical protein [Patescibacteria group bacterium]